jgi:hypothetical protein
MDEGLAKTRLCGLLLGAVLAQCGAAFADDWDAATDPDNGTATGNVPAYGSEQVHDLRALPGPLPDQDWYLLPSEPRSSYQFVVDGMTGQLDLTAADVQLFDAAGGLIGGATATDAGHVLSHVWLASQNAPENNFVKVEGASCGTACTTADRYRVRFYDTTVTVPRFNNSGTQATLLVLQNATARSCVLQAFYLDALGAEIENRVVVLLRHQVSVVDTRQIVPDRSGSVRIAHSCGYGGLAGKAVSLEPATGFTFDTPLLHRPR